MTSPSKDSPVLSLPQASPGANEDPFRAMLSTLIHETLEREFAQFLGARRFERSPERRDVRNGIGLARLKPSVSIAQAQEELTAISRQLAREFPATNEAVTLAATPLGEVFPSVLGGFLLAGLGMLAGSLLPTQGNVAHRARTAAHWPHSHAGPGRHSARPAA